MQTAPPVTPSRSRDLKDLLFCVPSVLSIAVLFLGWGALFGSQHWHKPFFWVLQVLFWVSPLVAVYTLGILVFYVCRRNPVGMFLALISLPVLGLTTYMVCGILIHGIALQP